MAKTNQDNKLYEASQLKLTALTKTGTECEDALNKLKPLASHLVKNDAKFVEFMFAKLWEPKFFEKKGEKIFVTYSELLAKLISVEKSLHERTIRFFISLFLGDKKDTLKDADQLTKTEQKLFPKIHYFLKSLCSKYPTIQSSYLDLILSSFPFTTVCTVHSFVCYFSNCSSIYLYEANEENRERVLWRLIDKLINIDSYLHQNKKSDQLESLNKLFEIGLLNMFKFINKVCLKGDLDLNKLNTLNDLRSVCNLDALKSLFDSLASIFITQIIKMDNTTGVNLIILYVCSLNEELGFQFLDLLWTEAFDVASPKPAAVNYFCSFLCKAKFISLDTLIRYMLKVSKKINNYLVINISIEDDLENFHKTLKKHKYFYAMCNCLFNLVCVRSQEFTDKHIYQLKQLNVQKIITCSLNPLAVCPIEIVKRFADICKYYNLGLCNMILQRNRRIGLYDLLKKRDVKFKLVYPFHNLQCNYNKLALVYNS